MTTSVALSPHFEAFIRRQVDLGRYNNASEVVRAGLRLLEEREAEQQLRLHTLREAVSAGLASETSRPADEVFERLEKKYQEMLGKNI